MASLGTKQRRLDGTNLARRRREGKESQLIGTRYDAGSGR